MRVQVANDTISRISNDHDHRDMLTNRNIADMNHSSIGKHVSHHIRSRGKDMRCQNIPYHNTMSIVVVHDKQEEGTSILERVKKMKL